MESVNGSFWRAGNWKELYNPIQKIPDIRRNRVQEYRPSGILFSRFAAKDSFIALCGYVKETKLSLLLFDWADARFTTKMLLIFFMSGKGGKYNTYYLEIASFLLPRCSKEILSPVQKVLYWRVPQEYITCALDGFILSLAIPILTKSIMLWKLEAGRG